MVGGCVLSFFSVRTLNSAQAQEKYTCVLYIPAILAEGQGYYHSWYLRGSEKTCYTLMQQKQAATTTEQFSQI